MVELPRLGFIENPTGYASLSEWLEFRESLLSVEQTHDVKELLKQCDEMIAHIRTHAPDSSKR